MAVPERPAEVDGEGGRAPSDRVDFAGTERFEIRRRIGAGGMGVVYLAYDRERGAEVALKTLRTVSGDALLYLKNEFRSLQDVTHPNLVSLGELIEDHGRWFFTMELVDGVDFIHHVRGVPRVETGELSRTDAASLGTAGEPTLVGHPRPGSAVTAAVTEGQLDLPRLRAAFVQLAHGLAALHTAGKIHRDVKPSNVLVTDDGRVVLLDFGLVLDRARDARTSATVVGTTAYMAPEQAASRPLGPEADWYAAGVLLYEALTGRVPFTGKPLQVMSDKQQHEPPPPRLWAPGIPPELDALCVELLRREPEARPSARQVLERFDAEPGRALTASQGPPPFVGRELELERLTMAFESTLAGRSFAVTVRGESGVGKSYLVRRFLERLGRRHPDALILTGRCYERESVPYKAFDGVVDEVTRFLAELPAAEVAALLPQRVALLANAFPVLRRVAVIAGAPRPTEVLDPQQLRTRVFAALRELFARLAERYRLVLAIDDVQWTDADSLALLRELLRPPGAPALLLVTTLRDTALAPTAAGELAEALSLAGRTDDFALSALSAGAAAELVATLGRRLGALPEAEMAAIAGEAGGHPLFIAELVHHVAEGGASLAGRFRLDDAILARVGRLDAGSRQIVELVATAGKPLGQDAVARAAGESFDDFDHRITALRVANLVRVGGARRADAIEPYHDRVREAVLGSLDGEQRAALHERLATALEATEHADAETLAVHWRGAGQPARAVGYALRAADEAATAVAFRRAARLYQLALELGVGGERRAVVTRMAFALANAGQGGDAARAYLEAAADAPDGERAELERLAVEQYLRAGYIDEGVEQARVVLGRVGMTFPRTRRAALLAVVTQRAALRLRGLRFRPRPASACASDELARVDTCWSMAALGFVDTIVGANFGARAVREALRLGEPARIARQLAGEAVYSAQIGGVTSARANRLLDLAERLAREGDHASSAACAIGCRGLVEFVRGNFATGRELLSRGERLYRSCVGTAWEVFICRMYDLICTFYEGDLPDLARRVPPLLQEADDCGDRFTAVSVRVALAYMVTLAADRPVEARRTVQEAMKLWGQSGFQMQHRYALLTEAELDLYEGDGAGAEARFRAGWPAIERSLLLRVRQQRIETCYARGRAALSAAGAPGADVRALVATAGDMAERLADERLDWAAGFGQLLAAGAAARLGRAEQARGQLARAVRTFDGLGMKLHAAAARRRHGELIGGSEGEVLTDRADAWLAAAGVVNPPRMVDLLAPGFG